jgi:hypothetical protein
MIRNRFFSIAAILVAGLVLAVLFVPGGAFAQDGSTGSGSNGQSGAAAVGSMIMQGWNHDQMHANASQHGAGQMGRSMMGTGHMADHANMAGTMNGTMATMHAGMMGTGMGNMSGGMMGGMMGTDAEHQQHMTGTDACPLAGDNTAEHAAECPYQSSTTAGE